MRLETKPIEETINGERKYAGLIISIIHNGKVVAIKAPNELGSPDNIVLLVRYLNKMVGKLSEACPELQERKTVESMKNGIEEEAADARQDMAKGKHRLTKSPIKKNGKRIQPASS